MMSSLLTCGTSSRVVRVLVLSCLVLWSVLTTHLMLSMKEQPTYPSSLYQSNLIAATAPTPPGDIKRANHNAARGSSSSSLQKRVHERVVSPDGAVSIILMTSQVRRCLHYAVKYNDTLAVGMSQLFLVVNHDPRSLCDEYELVQVQRREHREEWEKPYGQRMKILDHHHEAILSFTRRTSQARRQGEEALGFQDPGARGLPILFDLVARASNEGVAFRFVFHDPPTNPLLLVPRHQTPEIYISAKVNFTFGTDGTLYTDLSSKNSHIVHRLTSEVDSKGEFASHPFIIHLDNGLFVCMTEADNTEFEGLKFGTGITFEALTATFSRQGPLGPSAFLRSPWFVLVVGSTARSILENSHLVESLNPPSAIGDVSWIKAGRVFRDTLLTTETGLQAVSLASMSGWEFVLFEADWSERENATLWFASGNSKGQRFDFDVVMRSARRKKIGVWVTAPRVSLLGSGAEELLSLYASWGIAGVKVTDLKAAASQDTVFLIDLLKMCAKHKLMVMISEQQRPGGLTRTYPNLVGAWGFRIEEHVESTDQDLIFTFPRVFGGLGDYPFVYDKAKADGRSLMHQMALSQTHYSPLTHLFWQKDPWTATRHQRNVTRDSQHLSIWRDTKNTWVETRVLSSEIGDHIVIARKGEDGSWFLSAASTLRKTIEVTLDFLDPVKDYRIRRYRDHPGWSSSTASSAWIGMVRKDEVLTLVLSDLGGEVAILQELTTYSPGTWNRFSRNVFAIRSEPTLTWESLGLKNKPSLSVFGTDVFPKALGAQDSQVFLFSNDPRKYRVCTLFNVCLGSKIIYLVLENDDLRAEYTKAIAHCEDKLQKPYFCRCFPRDVTILLVKSLKDLRQPYQIAPGHTWVVDRLSQGQQDQNWAEVMTFFHSISMKPEYYRVPRIDRLGLLNHYPSKGSLEGLFFDLGTAKVIKDLKEPPIIAPDFELGPVCMQQVTGSFLTSTLAVTWEDVMGIRETANALIPGAKALIVNDKVQICPAAKAYLLVKNKGLGSTSSPLIGNLDDIVMMLKTKVKLRDLEVVEGFSDLTPAAQSWYFQFAGLIITTFGPAAIFSLLSQPGAVVLEVSPTHLGSDYYLFSEGPKVHYRVSAGGTMDVKPSPDMGKCNSKLKSCNGVISCIDKNLVCSKKDRVALQGLGFRADVAELQARALEAVELLQAACEGRWAGVVAG